MQDNFLHTPVKKGYSTYVRLIIFIKIHTYTHTYIHSHYEPVTLLSVFFFRSAHGGVILFSILLLHRVLYYGIVAVLFS